ncbi:MAG: dephospho-CoA kinase [Granulosicoccus sp.]
MLLIGLTGGIASGKSFVSRCFQTHNVKTIDADELAREVVEPGSAGLQALVDYFGSNILTITGSLDRSALRKIVFEEPGERAYLDKTLHPLIRELSEQRIEDARKKGASYIIYAVPLLVETDQQDRFDRIAVVDIPQHLQLERLMQRDDSSIEQAKNILKAQATREQRLAIADDVIDNSGTRQTTERRIAELHSLYIQLSDS